MKTDIKKLNSQSFIFGEKCDSSYNKRFSVKLVKKVSQSLESFEMSLVSCAFIIITVNLRIQNN